MDFTGYESVFPSFRPLAGNGLGKAMLCWPQSKLSEWKVSVPLRGMGWESFLVGITSPDRIEFPSPCGEWVGKEQFPELQNLLTETEFPSPCGEWVGKGEGVSSGEPGWCYWFPSPCGEWVGKEEMASTG